MTADDIARDEGRSKGWFAVLAVAAGIFVLVTSELLPIGLLTAIGADLGVTDARVGLMVTVPGLVAAFSAPTVIVLTRRFRRGYVLCSLMAVLAVANIVTAMGQSFGVIIGARVLVGVTIGGFWAIAGGLAVQLVRPAAVGRATSVILGGVAVAAVVGVPLGTLVGDFGSWRTAFSVSAAAALMVLAGLIAAVSPLPSVHEGVGLRDLSHLVKEPAVRLGLVIAALLVTGHFTAYAYLRPVIEELTAAGAGTLSVMLLAFGAAGIAGNVVAGEIAHLPGRTRLLLVAASLAVAMLAVPSISNRTAVTGLLLCLWGFAFGAAGVTLQTWMLQAAPRAAEGATALLSSTFNLSIALGAITGGLVVDRVGPTSVTSLGALLVGAAAGLAAVSMARARPAGAARTTHPSPGHRRPHSERRSTRTRGWRTEG